MAFKNFTNLFLEAKFLANLLGTQERPAICAASCRDGSSKAGSKGYKLTSSTTLTTVCHEHEAK